MGSAELQTDASLASPCETSGKSLLPLGLNHENGFSICQMGVSDLSVVCSKMGTRLLAFLKADVSI